MGGPLRSGPTRGTCSLPSLWCLSGPGTKPEPSPPGVATSWMLTVCQAQTGCLHALSSQTLVFFPSYDSRED